MGVIGLYKDNKLESRIKFPVTRAGDKSTVKYIIRNEIGRHVDIEKIMLEDKEVTIESFAKELDPTGKQEIVLTWAPSKDRLTPLETKIQFEVVIGKLG